MKTRQILLLTKTRLVLITQFCLIMDTRIPSSPPIPRPIWVLYDIYTTKPDYDRAFEEARRWVLEEQPLNKDGDVEKQLPSVAARI